MAEPSYNSCASYRRQPRQPRPCCCVRCARLPRAKRLPLIVAPTAGGLQADSQQAHGRQAAPCAPAGAGAGAERGACQAGYQASCQGQGAGCCQACCQAQGSRQGWQGKPCIPVQRRPRALVAASRAPARLSRPSSPLTAACLPAQGDAPAKRQPPAKKARQVRQGALQGRRALPRQAPAPGILTRARPAAPQGSPEPTPAWMHKAPAATRVRPLRGPAACAACAAVQGVGWLRGPAACAACAAVQGVG